MNILVISHLYPSKIRPNDGTFVHQQIEALQALGHNIRVVCPTPWLPQWFPVKLSNWKILKKLPRQETIDEISVYFKRGVVVPGGLDWTRGFLYYISGWFFYRKLFRNNHFDIIHAHTVLPDGHLASFLKKKYKIPYVVTIHGADLYYTARTTGLNKSHIYQSLKKSNGIGLVSQDLLKSLKNLYQIPESFPACKVIYNGIKVYDEYPMVEWGGPETDFRILSIASLIRRKNLHIVFRALVDLRERYKNLKYYIIGDGWHKEFYLELSEKLGLNDIVCFLGPMPHKKAMSYLKESDVFILPSYNESWGIVYVESMHMGKVTIAGKGEGISEIIQHGINGFLTDPHDCESVKEILEAIISDNSMAKSIGERAKRDVWPRFSWHNNAKEYHRLYQNSLKENK